MRYVPAAVIDLGQASGSLVGYRLETPHEKQDDDHDQDKAVTVATEVAAELANEHEDEYDDEMSPSNIEHPFR
jgi:hypothetical protein